MSSNVKKIRVNLVKMSTAILKTFLDNVPGDSLHKLWTIMRNLPGVNTRKIENWFLQSNWIDTTFHLDSDWSFIFGIFPLGLMDVCF